MNLDQVEKIAEAVLYEGYMLYPYRPSSVKNQQRWNFGVLCPPCYCELQRDTERSAMQTEVILRAQPAAKLRILARFLQVIQRSIGQLRESHTNPAASLDSLRVDFVSHLEINGRIYQPWQEAVERAITCDVSLANLLNNPASLPIAYPANTEREALHDASGSVAGVIEREWKPLTGSLDVAVSALEDNLFKLTIRISNGTAFDLSPSISRDEAMLFSFVSAHAILGVENGAFLSLIDPPARLKAFAATCKNIGTWPVMAGEDGASDVMLSSPIILYDYPQIAPESAGSLFDGTEIDEILSLRIMTLTDEEKCEIRQSDDRVREVLDRTENLPEEQFMKLHGVLRGLQTAKVDMR